MNNNGKIGAALVGGYLLGRTKKAKMAIGLGMFLAGKKLNLSPQQLARTLADSPVVGRLGDQVRKDLIGNTKSALTSAVTQRAGSLADSLHERTLSMNDPDRRARGSEDAGEEEAEEPDGADRAEGAADGRDEGEEREGSGAAPRARKAPAAGGRTAKTAKTRSSSASGSPDGKAASGGSRTGASRTGASRSGASRTGGGARKTASTASSGTRGAAGGARKTAAKAAPGGPRKAANRGGGNG